MKQVWCFAITLVYKTIKCVIQLELDVKLTPAQSHHSKLTCANNFTYWSRS